MTYSITYQDKTLTCRDCGREFAFTGSEQEFFAQKGFTNEPGRCPACRAARKASYSPAGYSPERQMHRAVAVCAQCGKETLVPFEPRNGRPVYCSDCFAAQRGNGGGYQSRDRNSGRSRRY